MQKVKKHGLVGDLWPHIRLMKISGMWILDYYEEPGGMMRFLRILYALFTTFMLLFQYSFLFAYLILDTYTGDQMASSTITFLFFTHGVTKYIYLALRTKYFYRVLRSWNVVNSHPLFAESNSRHRTTALLRMRKLLMVIGIGTLLTVFCWTSVTFIGDSVRAVPDPNNNNETIFVKVPRLMLGAHYLWDPSEGVAYGLTFFYQLYWLLLTLVHSNLLDVVFCSFAIFACEQLKHLKEIMRPLMELSAALDSVVPNAEDLFRATAADESYTPIMENREEDVDMRGIFSNPQDYKGYESNLINRHTLNPNGLTKKQELMVRSAIKYWVERHKHVVKYVAAIGESYGSALLLHMLTSTVTLTLLAYQATKIDGVDLYAVNVIGYLFFTLTQVFVFCIHGNELIEESSSVMEAAYSCHWYDGSEEAKIFVQIVCQQCQKSLSISGAKFFTVSLDLFASVLGAVVTYFMVLIQLK